MSMCNRGWYLIAYAIGAIFAVFALTPLIWMIFSSLKPYEELYNFPPSFSLSSLGLHYYDKVLLSSPFPQFLANSLIVSVVSTLISVLLAAMAGWSLARARFRGQWLILNAVLLAYLFPQALIVLPLFTAIAKIGLANTYLGLILAYITFTFPFSTWMLTAYFAKVPIEIEEAGRMDGASNLTIFCRLVLPLAAPGIVTVAIFSFINAWNEFLYGLVILGGGEKRTLPVGLYNFVGGEFAQWGEMMAATSLTMLPTLLLFLFIQRRLVGGLTAGAVKS
ncbi:MULTISPECIES: carbohydrate ABC transporter permease [unclassified Chelatococcus]|uniref:carbohydrate ABC transporter permease n=1 Tax=unclassified Chelatococcus TaxID=2638111 RepID=UPI001BCF4598|nr:MULTISPECIES: carbohydrate ABC transporter permease [unclassified Chelatococcus]MBS7699982.1 carbohydrate ABC transporter permease [Chelatococcus sp. YT9]MBX3558593.1 carbohydrate ABC transporter permease [Chelatococcus sp.]